MHTNYKKLSFSYDQTELTLLGIVIVFLIAFIILFILQVISWFNENLKSKTDSIKEVILRKVLFPFSLFVLMPSFFILFTATTREFTGNGFLSPALRSFLLLLVMLFLSAVLINELKNPLNKKRSRKSHRSKAHNSVLICFAFALTACMCSWIVLGI